MASQPAHTKSVRSPRSTLTWSLIAACTALCLFVPRSAYADPANNTVPDPGAPPVAAATVQQPGSGGTPTVTTPVAGPMGIQIMMESSAVEALGEQLKQARIDASAAQDVTVAAQQTWLAAESTARDLRKQSDYTAAEAYKKAQSLGPFDQYANTMHQLGVLAPGLVDDTPGGVAGSQTAAQDATRAEHAADDAYAAYTSALTNEQQKTQLRDQLTTSYNQRSAALETLRASNTQAVADAEAAQQAADARLAAQYAAGSNADGMVANPIVLKAITFALHQIGSPYVFGAEGPYNAGYDCSGLVWAAYRAAGIDSLPRIAKDQFHATSRIGVANLLPGDLVFFSTVSTTDWTTISHVGIYLGDNKMIEAPHTGDVVKIAPVWWSAFYGATRVVPAVPGPTPSPSLSPTATPSPTPSPSPSPTHSQPPSPSPSVSRSTSGSPSTPPSSTPSASPSPSPSPSRSPSPSPSVTSPAPTPTSPSPTVTSGASPATGSASG